ncbi:organic solvent tolerance protein OstA [Fischerella thermalis CCMEE 5205]|nr:organic solvent tolerance protein OstA [Fischerella thermalis CCMEE 5205]
MLHSVLPPEPPAIVEPLLAENLPVIAASDRQLHSRGEQAKAETLQQQPFNSSHQPVTDQSFTVKTPTIPAPESFPAEFSPLNITENSADLLGEPLSIGYSQQEPQITQDTNNSSQKRQTQQQIVQTIKNSKNRSQKKSQLLAEQLVQSKQNHTTAKNSQTSSSAPQPIKIKFRTANQQSATNNQLSTIEFKTRNLTSQAPQPAPTPTTPETRRVVEVIADTQEYDEQRRVVTAEGNVVVRFDGAVVDADRIQVSLDNLIAVGEGNVALTRGDQVLRGQRFTYNFVQDTGELLAGRGEIFIPTAQEDFAFLPTDVTAGGVPARPPSDRIRSNQPLTGVSSPGGINFGIGGRTNATNLPRPEQGGQVRRVRFEAARIDFYPRGWQASDVSLTNDPFSPPELELRANKVTLTRESPLQDRVRTENQRLVFDQGLSLPIPRNEQVIDRRERDATPGLVSFGFDGDQRGGVFVERRFEPINRENVSFSITPQFLAQKAVQEGVSNIPSVFGLRTSLDATLSPRTTVEGSGTLTSFDLTDIEDNLKASLRLRQQVGDNRNPHNVTLEYSYRDRLYNGSLGYQTVQSSFGGVVTSPIIPLGKTGLNLSYQGGAQYITANTDREDLLEPIRDNNRVSLGRLQASAALNGGLLLWQGKPLPPTATEGLRYTPNPVVPYLRAFGGLTGTTSYYTNGDNQSTLIGTIGLEGQIGHFSRSFLDYTAFNISYSQGLDSGESPFLFDRAVDTRTLSAGITQQIYGPFTFGVQTSVNLDTGEYTSTDFILQYSRRTYGITLRYNPELELGGISFRLSDFNWTGGTNPFSEVRPVVGGVSE